MKPVLFGYIGGKFYIAPKLIPLFPVHETYVEVFGGAGHILLQKPRSNMEVYNDINSNIVTLFRVLRDKQMFEEFYEKCQLTPHARDQKHECWDLLHGDEPLSDVDRAWCIYHIYKMSVGGNGKRGFPIEITGGVGRKPWQQRLNSIDKLIACSQRLMGVTIENQDYKYMIQTYDKSSTFFYLDPPYLPETRKSGGYTHEMTLADHEALIDILRNVKGKVMLSGYPNDLYDTLGWQTQSFETVCRTVARTRASGLQGVGNVKQNQKRTEKIWYNYPLPQSSLF